MSIHDHYEADHQPSEPPTSTPQFPDRLPGASSPAAERRMKAARRRDTKPEQLLAQELDRLGLVYVVDQAPIPGLRRRADMVFPEACVAVFVDGCFWHSCPQHGTFPKANQEWWRAKLEANQRRDKDTNRILDEAGWIVLRFWEHESAADTARTIADTIASRTPGN